MPMFDFKETKVFLGRSKDLTRRRFGRLTALRPWSKTSGGVLWLCKCRCGNRCIVRGSNLLSGKTKSCGCLQIDFAKSIIERTCQRQEEMRRFISEHV